MSSEEIPHMNVQNAQNTGTPKVLYKVAIRLCTYGTYETTNVIMFTPDPTSISQCVPTNIPTF